MNRYLIPFLALMLLFLSACQNSETAESPATVQLFAMDTVMELSAYGTNADHALALASDRINELDALLSTNQEGSEVYAANNSQGQPIVLSDDTAVLIQKALSVCAMTNGALDISIYPIVKAWGFTTNSYQVPDAKTLSKLLSLVDYSAISLDPNTNTLTLPKGMEIDLGSIAKGYTGDAVTQLLASNGITSAIINLGGNVQTLGTKPDGSLWNVAIQDPKGDDYLGTVAVADKAVITSGGYQRYFVQDGVTYHHIIDPASGYPANNGLISVTIVSGSGTLGDGLSTSLFVMGLDKAIDFWRTHDGFETVLVGDDGTVYVTEGLKDVFTPSAGVNVQIIEKTQSGQ